MNILFSGPHGTGKDTQALIFKERFGFKIISTGQILRNEVASGSDLGKQISEKIDNGHLVSDKLIFKILSSQLGDMKHGNYILNGVVRSYNQIAFLDELLKSKGEKLDRVIYFDLSDDEILARLANRRYCPKDQSTYHLLYKKPKQEGKCDLCGNPLVQRQDDKEDALKERSREFHMSNDAIVAEYKNRGLLIEVDARPGIDAITNKLIEVLNLN